MLFASRVLSVTLFLGMLSASVQAAFALPSEEDLAYFGAAHVECTDTKSLTQRIENVYETCKRANCLLWFADGTFDTVTIPYDCQPPEEGFVINQPDLTDSELASTGDSDEYTSSEPVCGEGQSSCGETCQAAQAGNASGLTAMFEAGSEVEGGSILPGLGYLGCVAVCGDIKASIEAAKERMQPYCSKKCLKLFPNKPFRRSACNGACLSYASEAIRAFCSACATALPGWVPPPPPETPPDEPAEVPAAAPAAEDPNVAPPAAVPSPVPTAEPSAAPTETPTETPTGTPTETATPDYDFWEGYW